MSNITNLFDHLKQSDKFAKKEKKRKRNGIRNVEILSQHCIWTLFVGLSFIFKLEQFSY